MAKQDQDAKAQEALAQARINSNRPELETDTTMNRATLANNWQAGSPAADYRDVANLAGENLATTLEAMAIEGDKVEAEPKEQYVSQAEWDRRTKLDVSNGEYINPSLSFYKVK